MPAGLAEGNEPCMLHTSAADCSASLPYIHAALRAAYQVYLMMHLLLYDLAKGWGK